MDMTILLTALLPILQSIVAAAAYDKVKNIMYADDGSDNDAFRKVMREAFVDAVKKTRKDANDVQIEKTEREEFRYYQKVIIDEIVHLEPTDKKKYINQDLYTAFKYEIMKRQDALSGLNLALAQASTSSEFTYSTMSDFGEPFSHTCSRLARITMLFIAPCVSVFQIASNPSFDLLANSTFPFSTLRRNM